mgnify:CR=1 FL=1
MIQLLQYLGNRNIAYEMLFNKEESIRNVLGGQAFATITLPLGLSVTVKGRLKSTVQVIQKSMIIPNRMMVLPMVVV